MKAVSSLLYRLAIACSFGFLSIGSALAQPDITKTEFMTIYEEAFRQINVDVCIKALPNEEFGFSVGESRDECDENFVFLNNAYDEYVLQADVDGQQEVLRRYLGLVLKIFENEEDEELGGDALRDKLVVQLRPTSYVDYVHSLNEENKLVARHFMGDLEAVLMKDGAESLESVSHRTLTENNISEDEAYALARENLTSLIGDIYEDEVEGFAGLTVVSSQNSLASGLLYQSDFCVAGSPNKIYFPFHRYEFFSVRVDNEASATALLRYAQSLVESEESMSNTLLFCQDGEFGFGQIQFEDAANSEKTLKP